MGEHLIAHVKESDVRADRVAAGIGRPIPGRLLRNLRARSLERIAHIHVNRRAITLGLPVAGHGNLVPRADVIIRGLKAHGARVGIRRPVEMPLSVQRHNLCAFLLARRQLECGVIRELVDTEHGGVFPVRNGCEALTGNRHRKQSQESESVECLFHNYV